MKNNNLPDYTPPPPPSRESLTKPDTTYPTKDDYTTHKVNNTSIWYTLGFLLPLILLLVVSTMACYKIQQLEKEIQLRETDYQILLQICNEKG